MIRNFTFTSFLLVLLARPALCDEVEHSPQIEFDWPTITVESVKYHLSRRFLNSDSYLFPVLIKEIHRQSMQDGMEGQDSSITLELWKLETGSVRERLWQVTGQADEWRYYGWEEIVLIKYGCCDAKNEYRFYDFKTGEHTRSQEGREIPPLDGEK
jgi:hypothetical protein